MGQKSYLLESNKNKITPLDLNKSFAKHLILSFSVSLIISIVSLLAMLVKYHNFVWVYIAILLVAVCIFLPVQGLVSERLYGTKHRLLCGVFRNMLGSRSFKNEFLINRFYRGLKLLCRNLGKHAKLEEVYEICCVGRAFIVDAGMVRDHGNGRWLRGAVQELNSFVENSNFYKPDRKPVYDTYKRLSRKWADDGERLFRTREQAEFESWT
ncbi:hypothetical protein GKC30_13640 [Pseudodesulfovibrio sp. F-1]|uniref:Uncharacterized protein n=1 Tax=Pseudodesulfovibrio alkaliphilus TaxID=2661613 RepID=A0A7K1KRI1_9BACT|nr:hypothetical protein [Pseudodesulfovibrio alkaliphilus]MUM78678.1 hypothetical protein [Pseudodesulfovibrio alkaliphilus]